MTHVRLTVDSSNLGHLSAMISKEPDKGKARRPFYIIEMPEINRGESILVNPQY